MPVVATPIEVRLWRFVDASGDCWLWTGSRTGGGYGRVAISRRTSRPAHRMVWQMLVGPIPEGYQLDHLCRNPSCVNPDHLEPVTPAENQRRSPLVRSRRTHCPQGHEYTPENTVLSKRNQRSCRECVRIFRHANRARLSAARRLARHAAKCLADNERAEG